MAKSQVRLQKLSHILLYTIAAIITYAVDFDPQSHSIHMRKYKFEQYLNVYTPCTHVANVFR